MINIKKFLKSIDKFKTGLARDFKRGEKQIDRNVKKKLKKMGKDQAQYVVDRTQGLGLDSRLKKVKALKKETKKERQKLADEGQLSPLTEPNMSNLTRTGELMSSIKSKQTKQGFEIYAKGERNEIIIDGQDKQGRPVLNLDKNQIEQIDQMVEDEIEAVFDKIFNGE